MKAKDPIALGSKPKRVRKRREKITPERIVELRAMPYAEYLKTPEWQAKRVSVIRFYCARCQICNSPMKFNVHHRTYERIGEERLSDLVLLCRDCHKLFHDNCKLARPR